MSPTSNNKAISGFSKLSKRGKIKWIVEHFFKDPESVMHELMSYWHKNEDQQKILDGFSENTISNFPMPFSVAPNFLINGKTYCIPMVIEESSVVAAASSAAKFWMNHGGFTSMVLSTLKLGQIHFYWNGSKEKLESILPELTFLMKENAKSLLHSMEKRGGGVRHFELIQINELEQYFQIRIGFETCDSMGANFINSCLESFSHTLEHFIESQSSWTLEERDINILMSILSNYTPECIVRVSATCPVDDFSEISDGMSAAEFAERFYRAIQIAKIDPYRAVTHNKGIFNGIDSVVIATGNDFRAIEACGHAYASRDGAYRSLSDCSIINNVFTFWLDIPLALGTIGGLTELHPIAKRSLELLGNPSAEELMQVTAATGLAQNFAAIKSLITTGIQQGHMKMHLGNILNHLKASPKEINLATAHFQNQKISFTDVRLFIEQMRSNHK